jgi:hypothetical protein
MKYHDEGEDLYRSDYQEPERWLAFVILLVMCGTPIYFIISKLCE